MLGRTRNVDSGSGSRLAGRLITEVRRALFLGVPTRDGTPGPRPPQHEARCILGLGRMDSVATTVGDAAPDLLVRAVMPRRSHATPAKAVGATLVALVATCFTTTLPSPPAAAVGTTVAGDPLTGRGDQDCSDRSPARVVYAHWSGRRQCVRAARETPPRLLRVSGHADAQQPRNVRSVLKHQGHLRLLVDDHGQAPPGDVAPVRTER